MQSRDCWLPYLCRLLAPQSVVICLFNKSLLGTCSVPGPALGRGDGEEQDRQPKPWSPQKGLSGRLPQADSAQVSLQVFMRPPSSRAGSAQQTSQIRKFLMTASW